MSGQLPELDRLDEALAKRLSKLAGVPVDTARLERRLAEALRRQDPQRQVIAARRWWRPLGSAAAAVLILGVLGWIVVAPGSPAIAAPTELVRVHQDLAGGNIDHNVVNNIDEANQRIAAQWAQAPQIPPLHSAQIKSCCLHRVRGVRVACVLMEHAGQPVTLVVASGKDMCSPRGRDLVRAGRKFVAHEQDNLRMVMTRHGDRWLCVMGELSAEQLLDLADEIVF